VGGKPSQRRTVGHENGEVIQTESAVPRHSHDAPLLHEVYERTRGTSDAERCFAAVAFAQVHSEHALVVSEGALQVADL
jgi:hypothetical protein